jgi:uncharacterized RDD family membrane protein YckC
MSDRQPPPHDGAGEEPGPWQHNPYGQQPGPYDQPNPHGQEPNPYGQQAPYGQGGIPSYPGGGYPDAAAYGQQPTGMPPLANWGLRAASYLIDAVIIAVPYFIVRVAIGGAAGALLSGLIGLIGTLGFSAMEGATGQTPGKKVVGTRTLREADGQVLGFGRAFGRRLLHILDAIPCYLGFLWPAWDEKKQTFADKLVHSVVIKG